MGILWIQRPTSLDQILVKLTINNLTDDKLGKTCSQIERVCFYTIYINTYPYTTYIYLLSSTKGIFSVLFYMNQYFNSCITVFNYPQLSSTVEVNWLLFVHTLQCG